jgi:uncharacterized membrane-anchored protein YjiN (DUF445 family)
MHRTATGLLAAMAVLFVAARGLRGHTGADWVLAFAEAAMVGGLADWFAVTALFRRPLGLPIPHTAIIPENKDRIADTMAAFLRANFLTPQVVARRLAGMNLAAAAGAFLSGPRNGAANGQSRVRAGAAQMAGDMLESLDRERLGGMVRAGLRQQIERLDLAPLLGQMLSAAIADRRHLPVIESLLRWTGHTVEANEDLIRAMIHERANSVLRWTGLDERVATAVLDGLYKLLAETIVDPAHPLRAKVDEGLETLAERLSHDPAMAARVAAMKAELLGNAAVTAWLDAMWERIRAALLKALRDPQASMNGSMGAVVAQGLGELGAALAANPQLQRHVNRFARRTLVGLASRHGDQIVRLVSETVKRWDATTVTSRIEGAVGRDLQFIRINGTLVGGLVGLAIHAAEVLL